MKSSKPDKTDAMIARIDRNRDITKRISSASDSGSSSASGKGNMVSRLGEQSFRIQKAKAGASNPAHNVGKGSK